MGRKLHERFIKVDPHDRDSCRCAECDKIRAICRDCECCYDCCRCEYCSLCGLPNGLGVHECTCFDCPDCNKTCPEEEQAVDDGDYASENFDPSKHLEYVCLKCYEKRKAKSVKKLQ